jgi:hypothetical protein
MAKGKIDELRMHGVPDFCLIADCLLLYKASVDYGQYLFERGLSKRAEAVFFFLLLVFFFFFFFFVNYSCMHI